MLTRVTDSPSSSPLSWLGSFSSLLFRRNVRLPSPHFHGAGWVGEHRSSGSLSFIREPGVGTIRSHIFLLLVCLLADVVHLCIAITAPVQRAYFRLRHGSGQQTATLDLYCISRTLQTSLDIPTRLSALNYLANVSQTPFDTPLVIDCFNTLIGCVEVTNGKVTMIKGLEQLATASALCCIHTLSHLAVTDTIVNVEMVRRRYTRVFPPGANFDGLPFSYTLGAIHTVFYQPSKFRVGFPTSMVQMTLITWRAQLALQNRWWEERRAWRVQWEDYEPSNSEHTIVSRALTKLAQFEYRRRGHRKVPRWLLRFAFHSLSQNPQPPTSVIINCLSIIAIDMGCNLANTTTLHERCVYILGRYTPL